MLLKFIYLIGVVFSYPINYYCTNESGICLDGNFKNRFYQENLTYTDSIVDKKISMMIYFYYDDSSDISYYSKLDNIYRYIIQKKIINDDDKLKKEFDTILFSNNENYATNNENHATNDKNHATNDKNCENYDDEILFDNISFENNYKFDFENIYSENLLITLIKKFFYIVFYLLGVFGVSSLISAILIGKYIYKNMKSNKRYLYIEDENLDQKDFYQFNYIEEYDKLEDIEITEEKLKNIEDVFISEETPKGLIHMSYDRDQEAFIYYAKSSSVFSYNYLDCVARHFVIKFNCKKLYYHLHDEIVKSYNMITKDNNEDDENYKNKEASNEDIDLNNVRYSNTPSETDEDVFANLKSYNKKSNEDSKNKTIDKKCNKFIYKGTLFDYNEKYIDDEDIDIDADLNNMLYNIQKYDAQFNFELIDDNSGKDDGANSGKDNNTGKDDNIGKDDNNGKDDEGKDDGANGKDDGANGKDNDANVKDNGNVKDDEGKDDGGKDDDQVYKFKKKVKNKKSSPLIKNISFKEFKKNLLS